jgi:hypothetical protein
MNESYSKTLFCDHAVGRVGLGCEDGAIETRGAQRQDKCHQTPAKRDTRIRAVDFRGRALICLNLRWARIL